MFVRKVVEIGFNRLADNRESRDMPSRRVARRSNFGEFTDLFELLNLLVFAWLCVVLLGCGGIGLVVDIVRVKVLNEGNQMKGLWIVVNAKRLIGGMMDLQNK